MTLGGACLTGMKLAFVIVGCALLVAFVTQQGDFTRITVGVALLSAVLLGYLSGSSFLLITHCPLHPNTTPGSDIEEE